jgi:hypothetical protein
VANVTVSSLQLLVTGWTLTVPGASTRFAYTTSTAREICEGVVPAGSRLRSNCSRPVYPLPMSTFEIPPLLTAGSAALTCASATSLACAPAGTTPGTTPHNASSHTRAEKLLRCIDSPHRSAPRRLAQRSLLCCSRGRPACTCPEAAAETLHVIQRLFAVLSKPNPMDSRCNGSIDYHQEQ